MHDTVEGLCGVEVTADDFIVLGFGDNIEPTIKDHDRNLAACLQCARDCGLMLNANKIQLWLIEVLFIPHLTANNLLAVPAKVEAILELPNHTDLKALQRFLGMVNYLAKFLPNLSMVCDPLRHLEHKDIEWCWLKQHEVIQLIARHLTSLTLTMT